MAPRRDAIARLIAVRGQSSQLARVHSFMASVGVTIPRRLIIIVGQEGAGKSALVRALVRETARAAQIDAEDVGQVNPWSWDDAFKALLWNNVAALARNFWQAGYTNVIAGSFINDHADYVQFRTRIDDDVAISLIQLCASKSVRDQRRMERVKPSTKEWRDELDQHFPEDSTLRDAQADYYYVRIDNSELALNETVEHITKALPEVFQTAPGTAHAE